MKLDLKFEDSLGNWAAIKKKKDKHTICLHLADAIHHPISLLRKKESRDAYKGKHQDHVAFSSK